MQQTIRLARIWGIDIGIHYTWLITFGLITWTLASSVFPAQYPHWTPGRTLATGVITSLLFFASVVLHELGHAWQALRRGIPVADITLFIFGGAARITREAEEPQDELTVAAAGPAVSLFLAGAMALLHRAFHGVEVVAAAAHWLARVNLGLAVFNLLPGFPMDGGRILRALAWRATGDFQRATRIASRVGQAVAYMFIGLGLFTAFQGAFVSGLWIILIGWFVLNAAESGYRDVVVRNLLRGVSAERLMQRDFPSAPGSTSVERLVDDYILGKDMRFALVMDGDRLRGIVTLTDIRRVTREAWAQVSIEAIMTPVPLAAVGPATSISDVVALLGTRRLRTIPVLQGDQVLGVIDREDILRFLHLRQELGAGG